jgi:cell division septation protein DedD
MFNPKACRHWAIGSVTLLALSACGGGAEPEAVVEELPPEPAPVAAPAPEPVVEEAEVLRPDLYNVTDMGLWDGRPSIGGIWIAHPNVEQAERVRITNIANGRSVTGAVFARDPSIPGPPFLISGEAAATLGAEPGVPSTFNVVALRRELVDASTTLETTPITETTPTIELAEPPQEVASATQEALSPTSTAPTPRPGVAAATLGDTSSLDKPFIQVGAFAVQDNARKLRTQLESEGYSVRTAPLQGQTRTLTRVLVGPALSIEERDRLLRDLRNDGFIDALVTRL